MLLPLKHMHSILCRKHKIEPAKHSVLRKNSEGIEGEGEGGGDKLYGVVLATIPKDFVEGRAETTGF